MSITPCQFIKCIEAKNEYPLDSAQIESIIYGNGPLLIAAGPGTGKTEVLVTRCLKFICCDDVDPGSVMLTTFTEKAARNLEDRMSEAFLFLASKYRCQLADIDPSNLRIGTLHGLCNDILQEYRYTDYLNRRLLNEVESALLIHKSALSKSEHIRDALFDLFPFLFKNKPREKLSRWDVTFAIAQLFNRFIEDRVDLRKLHVEGGSWAILYEANQIYEDELATAHACDFSRLLRYFLEFLETAQGESFLRGDTNVRKPLTHVLVDEYQDTNPIQESIYFRLCDTHPHNLTVVGDDDQSLYRFRGGTVECMVGFSSSCDRRWDVRPQVTYLCDNHRSDRDIVDWCNNFIASFPRMTAPNVRIAGKPPLESTLGRTGQHPGVGLIRANTIGNCARGMADLVCDLHANGIIQDYSQCVLLLRSTKNSSRYAGPYHTALRDCNIPVYNPRAKDYLEQPEVAQCLGAFIRIIDPDLNHIRDVWSPSIQGLVSNWVDEYDSIVHENTELAEYVTRATGAIVEKGTSERITSATPTILYRILSHSPFVAYQENPDMDLRLSQLTRLFESFCAQYGRELKTDTEIAGELPRRWYGGFFYGLCGYLVQKGLDDDEDDEVNYPSGYFPIMTIHQAKGLEFDFVFVGNLGASVRADDAHLLERDLRLFRSATPIVHTIDDAMWHDSIRQHFVAYSRAKYALILVATDSQLRKRGHETASFGAQGGGRVRQVIPRL